MKSNNAFEEPKISKANSNKIHSNKKNHKINNHFNYFYDYSNHDLITDDENNCSITLSNTNNVEEWNWNFNEIDYDFDFEMNSEELLDLDSSSFLKSLDQNSSKKFRLEELETIDLANLNPKEELNHSKLIESTLSQTFDLLQTAAEILSESQNSDNTTFQFDTELIDLEESNKLYFVETSTPTDDFYLKTDFSTDFQNEETKFQVNDYVSINNKKRGCIKYIGTVHFAAGIFCGIELDEAEGRHDGQIDEIRYFQCKQSHGIFAPVEKINLVSKLEEVENDVRRRSFTKLTVSSSTSTTSSSSTSSLELIKSESSNNNNKYNSNSSKYTFRPIKSAKCQQSVSNERANQINQTKKSLNNNKNKKMLANTRHSLPPNHKTNVTVHSADSSSLSKNATNLNSFLNSKSTSSTGSTSSTVSSSSTCSTVSSSSSSSASSSNPVLLQTTNSPTAHQSMLSRLSFQSKLNKFNSISESPPTTATSSTTTTPTSLIPCSLNNNSKLGLFQLSKTITTTTNNNINNNTANTQITSNDNYIINTSASQQPSEQQQQKKLSKLKPPSNLSKYTPPTSAQSVAHCVVRHSMQTNVNQITNSCNLDTTSSLVNESSTQIACSVTSNITNTNSSTSVAAPASTSSIASYKPNNLFTLNNNKQNNINNNTIAGKLPATDNVSVKTQNSNSNATNGDSKLKLNLNRNSLKLTNDSSNCSSNGLAIQCNLTASFSNSSSSSSVNNMPKKSPNTSPIRKSAQQIPTVVSSNNNTTSVNTNTKTKPTTSLANTAQSTFKSSAIPSLASVRHSFHHSSNEAKIAKSSSSSTTTHTALLNTAFCSTGSVTHQSVSNQHNLAALSNHQNKNEQTIVNTNNNNKLTSTAAAASSSLIKSKVFQPAKVQSIPAITSSNVNTSSSLANKNDEITNSSSNIKKQTKLITLNASAACTTPSFNSTDSLTNMSSIQQPSTKSTVAAAAAELGSNQIRNINQMNETFDVDDELFDGDDAELEIKEEATEDTKKEVELEYLSSLVTKRKREMNQEKLNSLSDFIENQKSKNNQKQNQDGDLQAKSLFDNIGEEQRRRSILIESNFDFTAGINNSDGNVIVGHTKSLNDYCLENELIPDDFLDDMNSFIETTNSLIIGSCKQLEEKQELLNEINLLNTVNNNNNESQNENEIENENMNTSLDETAIELDLKETPLPQQKPSRTISMTTNDNSMMMMTMMMTHLNSHNAINTIDKEVEHVVENLVEKLCQTNHYSQNTVSNAHMMKDNKIDFSSSNDKHEQSALNQIADDYDAINRVEIGVEQEQEDLNAVVVESESELDLLEEQEHESEEEEEENLEVEEEEEEEDHPMNKTFDLNETIEAAIDTVTKKLNNNLDQCFSVSSSDMQNKSTSRLSSTSVSESRKLSLADKNRIPTKLTQAQNASAFKRASVPNSTVKAKKPTTQSIVSSNETKAAIKAANSNEIILKKAVPYQESLVTTTKNQRRPIQKVFISHKVAKQPEPAQVTLASCSSYIPKDDDLNCVFEADNQTNTTCSSDNDESAKSSLKSNSSTVKTLSSAVKTRGKRISRIINELNTAVSISSTPVVNSSLATNIMSPAQQHSLPTISTTATVASLDDQTNFSSNSLNTTPSSTSLIAQINASTASTSYSPTSSTIENLTNHTNTTFNSSVNSTASSKLSKPNFSSNNNSNNNSNTNNTTSSVKKQHSNNKENQQGKMPKSLALNKIYKSRDGLAAVSSNTSIMSEVSNISKSSLPSSIPTASLVRPASVVSAASSVKQQLQSNATPAAANSSSAATAKHLTQTPLLLQSRQFQEQQKHLASSSTNKLQSQSSKQQLQQLSSGSRTHLGTYAMSNHALNSENARKTSAAYMNNSHLADSIKNTLRKPGNHQTAAAKANEALLVNTATVGVNQTASSSSSPSSSSTSSSKINKNEVKLNKEIKRLEALCESRTKELTMHKLKLRDALTSFDAIAVAFNYLSNDLNGFEAPHLRTQLSIARRQHNELVKKLRSNIDEKESQLKALRDELEKLTIQSTEIKQRLEKEIKKISDEHLTILDLNRKEHDLIVETLTKEKDTNIKRLNKSIENMKLENEKLVNDLSEQLKTKQTENIDLTNRIKECEETLAKDKDERIQRLIDTQRNLEKEIESLKAALDIKNIDIFELRTKNNELITKLEGFNELNAKCRRYKQELEQANAILANKQEAEKLAYENNRLLAAKIEVKNRENQRLSMANEQLQFRLNSHPNLSINTNGDNSFNMSSVSINPYDDPNDPNTSKCKRASTANESHNDDSTCMDNQNSGDHVDSSNMSPTPPVKLRSKSFKTQQSHVEHSNKKSHSGIRSNNQQYRPVSEMYHINISDRDTLMTRSYTTASSSSASHHHNHVDVNTEDNLDTTIDISNNVNSTRCVSSSSSSSISHLDSNSQSDDPMTKSCMLLKSNDNESTDKFHLDDNILTNHADANNKRNFFSKTNNNDNSLSSSSSVSINEHSVIILD